MWLSNPRSLHVKSNNIRRNGVGDIFVMRIKAAP